MTSIDTILGNVPAPTAAEIKAALAMTIAVAEAIRELGSVPSGLLYAQMMGKVEFAIIDRLNALEKYADAGKPFMETQFVFDPRGFWVHECPRTGYGFFYKTLDEAVKRWRVSIVGFDCGVWRAVPIA